MWWGFWLLVSLAVVWGLFDYYYWSLRLPQERVLTNLQGDTMHVRIEGRAPEILKLTMLDDGSSRLYPIFNLVEDDRAHVERLPIELSFVWPLQYTLTQNGSAMPARLEGRTEKLLKWTSLNDQVTHWESLDNLSAADKALVEALPASLAFNYPLDMQLTDKSGHPFPVSMQGRSASLVRYTFPNDTVSQTVLIGDLSPADQSAVRNLPVNLADDYPINRVLIDKAGHAIPATIIGRSDTLVKFTLTTDGSEQTLALADLSKEDQALLDVLPVTLSNNYPVDRLLTDKTGRSFQASIDGRSDTLVQYTTPNDSTEQSMAMVDLSAEDQAFIHTLPVNLTYNYPQDWTLTDERGRPLRVSIQGRTTDVVKIILQEDNSTHLYPIATLSEKDQAFLHSLPVNLILEYPLKSTLTDQQGHTLSVTIVGRTDSDVQFTRDDDGKSYTYAIDKLSEADQAYVRLLPINQTADVAAPAAPAESLEVKNMRDRVNELRSQIADINSQIAGLGSSDTARAVLNNDIKSRQTEMNDLMIKILNSEPPPQVPANGQDVSATVAQLQQQISDLESRLSHPPAKNTPSYVYQQMDNQLKSAEDQLNQIYQQTGTSAVSGQ